MIYIVNLSFRDEVFCSDPESDRNSIYSDVFVDNVNYKIAFPEPFVSVPVGKSMVLEYETIGFNLYFLCLNIL